MRYTTVGRSGLKVSAIGLGCNNFGMRIDQDGADKVVGAALDAGVTHFDTADMYGGGRSEVLLGKALGARRDEVVVATKFGARVADGPYGRGASRRHIVRSCDASLKRLGTDRIDLYYQHYADPDTPIEETLTALDDLVQAGKVLYAGTSNLAAWQLADAAHVAGRTRFVGAQIEWSLLKRTVERDMVPAARHFGVGVIPYFPLASGLLSGKYRRGEEFPADSRFAALPFFAQGATDDNFVIVERLTAYAEGQGLTLLELALSWLAAQPEVASVLVGATRPEQAAANAAAIVDLTPAQVAEVAELAAAVPA
ncbi:aldo/keto reductase [Embleya sp. NBC_00896]|uniref:aldo/keto reductase n=1 Tax=Embleya sp. NBC_00896 TaxID=2975961 RepID=UPI00386367CF|nr:aldo/keto reductase [Embleya sp. NBC_00896]